MLQRFKRRLATLGIRSHLPQRTIRRRLTAIYGGLFLLSGAALLTTTYLLVRHATAGNECYNDPSGFGVCTNGKPPVGSPSMAPTTGQIGSGRDALTPKQLATLANNQHADMLHQLLIQSGIALAIMTAVSIALGWVIAGRVLRPLRTITDGAQSISATNLHERLALTGPDDELKKLGDTIDALLARLDDAFDAQRRFVANASHELRTPLTVVRALLQMVLTDPDASLESFRATCRDVLAEGERQERLIEALLVLARTERGLDHRAPFDLGAVADEVLQARQASADRLDLQMQASIAPAPVDGDARLAERLVANLVDNALRHNVDGGRVSVSTGIRQGRSFVSVINTGPAVLPEQVHRLFQPFQRLGADSVDNSEGLGLGLSIVAAIANAHDATVTTRPHADGGLDIEVGFPPPQVRTEQPRRTGPARIYRPPRQAPPAAAARR